MVRLGETPSQTVGPYFSMSLERAATNCLVWPDGAGHAIRVEGRVLDGDRHHIEDALLELWQADPSGHYLHPADVWDERRAAAGCTGFGRAVTAFATGEYWFATVKPGRVPDAAGRLQAPHLNLIVQARGMNNPLFTRIYFGDEADANGEDPTLRAVPPERRPTLIASPAGDAIYTFDIRLQGADETVFFDFR